MQEIESLGPMKKLAPGKSVEHVETWELVGHVDNLQSENDIDNNVFPKIK
jgi:hypothetical protein